MREHRLNDQELDQLVKSATMLQETDKNITWVTCLLKSQEELFPQEKHYSKSTIYNISKDLKRRMVPGKIVVNPTFSGKPPLTKTGMDVEFSPTKTLSGPDTQIKISEIITPKSYIPNINRFTFSDKITELASCLAKQFEDQLNTELETALNTAMSNVERSFTKKLEDARKLTGMTRKQLPRVMVIGVMGEVAFQTESEYGEMLDLRFYKQEENLSLIRAQVKHCDYVVLIVGHVNHGHQDCVRDHPGLIFCNGGVTQMKEILLNLACK